MSNSLVLIKSLICDYWIGSFGILPDKQNQVFHSELRIKVMIRLLESMLLTEEEATMQMHFSF